MRPEIFQHLVIFGRVVTLRANCSNQTLSLIMYVRRHIRFRIIWRFAWRNLVLFTLWSLLVTAAYVGLKTYSINIGIPFAPLSTIGIAVAFYVGFKNSQSYDRFWEGRKIWGGVVNYSRTWANQVLTYVHNQHATEPVSGKVLHQLHQELIYRHLAWINALRIQLRKTTMHDRDNLSHIPDFQLQQDRECTSQIGAFLSDNEFEEVMAKANTATHLVKNQGQQLRRLEREGLVENFRMIDMMQTLEELYNLQGKCERIKNTPFPRQYAYFSAVFVWIFVLLVPFGLVSEFDKLSSGGYVWLTVPFSILISWIFTTIEIVGDNSEDPFENYVNDVPMTALCRTIEIDLREMLDETDLPEKIKPVEDVLM